jgi:uncharacterized protein YndB with AHSA1/START domain
VSIRVEIPVEIAAPVDAVFALVTDPARLPEWQDTTIAAEIEGGGPLREGVRIRETHKGPFGRRLDSVVEVARFEPDRRFDLRIVEGPIKIHGDHSFSAAGDGTRLDFVAHGELPGPLRLLGPLAARMLQRQFRGHFEALKRLLEAGPGR